MREAGKPLDVEVKVWAQTLWSGHRLMAPVSELDRAALGDAWEAEEALEAFLKRYLEHAPAPVLARFSLPANVHLRKVEVEIPRVDLPRRREGGVPTPIEIAALVIPADPKGDEVAPGDAWVVVPTLDHTFFVPRTEPLDDAIRAEVRRTAAVLKPEALDYLELLPPEDVELVSLTVSLPRDAGGAAGAKARKRLAEAKKKADAWRVLTSVARPMSEPPGFRPGPEAVGVEEAQGRLTALLCGPERVSVLLVGEPRVGKSELLWQVIRAKRQDGLPPVWATSGAQLIAGMSGLGQWQERVRRVMEAAETLDAILYIDDVVDLFGDTSHGLDIPGAMRGYLEDRRVRLVTEVTPAALDRLESRNLAFFAALNRVRLEAQDRAAGREAVRRRARFVEGATSDAPRLDDAAVEPLVELTHRYFPYRPFPAKAVDLYEAVRSLAEQRRDGTGEVPRIDPAMVRDAFSVETGIPAFLLRDDVALKASEVEAEFGRRLVGQRAAVRAVVDTICVVKAALQPTGKPLATFLFVGPTGVGKTELARTLARFLFGSEERLVRFDMSEFGDPLAAERLIRGTERQEGLLTRRVRTQPFSVLLLDEIEKADPSVFDLLLQVTGEGRLTDARGQTTWFQNTIIVMTSNLGAAHRRGGLGFEARPEADQRYYMRQVERSFRPELVNRLERVIAFEALTPEQLAEVTQLALQKVQRRRGVVDRGIALEASPAALARLAADGYSEAYGARAIRRHLDDAVAAPLAGLLAQAGPMARAGTVQVRLQGEEGRLPGRKLTRQLAGALELVLLEGQQLQARRDTRHVETIAELRREVERNLALDRVEEVKAHLRMVRSQLNVGGEGTLKKRRRAMRQDRRTTEDMAALSKEHHRLQEVLHAAEGARDALVAAEELALGALMVGEETAGVMDDAQAAHHGFMRNLAYLLLAMERRRDEITLILQEVSPRGGMALWLLPMLDAAERRGWTVELHVPGERGSATEPWPELVPWGPGRSPDELRRRFDEAAKRGEPRPDLRDGNLLLRVKGPWAGALLTFEQGVHLYEKHSKDGGSPKLFVRLAAMRFEHPEKEWRRAELAPLLNPLNSTHARGRPVRTHGREFDRLELARAGVTLTLPLEQYWARIEEVVTAELLACERDVARDRDAFFAGHMEGGKGVEA
ncbi:MAG: ATP-dependent Clp protease ATP-binding subunit [Myxococcales bacterium]|nr:ATP-dependent Clp protease ATP-binding subunit [Myxococcales bacterium]